MRCPYHGCLLEDGLCPRCAEKVAFRKAQPRYQEPKEEPPATETEEEARLER